jgi:hypothetical protein
MRDEPERQTFVVLALAHACALAFAALGCDRPSSPHRVEATPAAPAASTPPSPLASTPSRVAPPTPSIAPSACTPAPSVEPVALSASWPQRLGARVRFVGHIERSLDLLTALVVAKGERFVVVLDPEQAWTGDRERVYRVMGSAAVALGGRTSLPQLLLEGDETCVASAASAATSASP